MDIGERMTGEEGVDASVGLAGAADGAAEAVGSVAVVDASVVEVDFLH